MAHQTNESFEKNHPSSSSDDDYDETDHHLNLDAKRKDMMSINEDDWSSSDDEISHHHTETETFIDLDWIDIPSFIQRMDQGPMNRFNRQQARHDKEKVLSLRRHLAEKHQIIRPTYKGFEYHLYSADDFKQKESEFMTQIGIYSFIQNVTHSRPNANQKCLADIVDPVETTLTNLLHSKCITEVQYMKMKVDRSSVRLSYLYFVSDTDEEEIPIRPIMVCNNGPTTGISRYLGRLLGLFFNEATHCTTYSKSVDVIDTLELYSQRGHLLPTTLFAKLKIDDLCTMFSHQRVIEALEHFLNYYMADNSIATMPTTTILQLVRLVLENQYFVHNNKLYRQTAGGFSGSLLTIPLAYIYLFYWQQNLLNALVNKNELFGRFRDEAFITWNGTEDDLQILMATTNSQFPQLMRLFIAIGTNIHFRDIDISIDNGVLRTTVYDRTIFEYKMLSPPLDVIPRPIQDTSKWLRAALLKAARYCSDDDAFHTEKSNIKFALDQNRIPQHVYDEGFSEFINQFGVSISARPSNRTNYEIFREHVRKYDRYRRATKAHPRIPKEENILYLPYTSDWDTDVMTDFEEELNKLVREHFTNQQETKTTPIKIKQHRRPPIPFNDLIVMKRPPISLLTLTAKNKNNFKF